ncbi:MAG: type II toxin-antitoxin system RelE/ParE family toxin [Rhizomicrobium sp.]
MRIFQTKPFVRFARRERIRESVLIEAIERAEMGLVAADLGGGLFKQRIARPGQGRSGGYRTLIAIRWGTRAFFLSGFAKNERENIDADELAMLKELAQDWLTASDAAIEGELLSGNLQEIRR